MEFTLVVNLFAVNFVVGTILLIAGLRDSTESAASRYWSIGFYTASVGWFAALMTNYLAPLQILFLTNACFALAPCFIVAGVLARDHKAIYWRMMISAVLVIILVQIGIIAVTKSEYAKIMSVHSNLFVLQSIAGILALRSKKDRYASSILAFGIFCVSALSLYRIITVSFIQNPVYGLTTYNFIALSIVLITEGFTCLGALLLDLIDRVSRQAMTDPLTNCLNRRGFDYIASGNLEKARRSGVSVVAIIADLDDLKKVNDSYGHRSGDQAIISFANTLSSELRNSDVMCRLGGEEFVVVLWDCDLPCASEIVLRVQKRLRDLLIPSLPVDYRLTSSFGATLVEKDESDIEALIHRADMALYRAKRAGKDQMVAITRQEFLKTSESA